MEQKSKQLFCGDYHTRRVAHELDMIIVQQTRASERAHLSDSELTSVLRRVRQLSSMHLYCGDCHTRWVAHELVVVAFE